MHEKIQKRDRAAAFRAPAVLAATASLPSSYTSGMKRCWRPLPTAPSGASVRPIGRKVGSAIRISVLVAGSVGGGGGVLVPGAGLLPVAGGGAPLASEWRAGDISSSSGTLVATVASSAASGGAASLGRRAFAPSVPLPLNRASQVRRAYRSARSKNDTSREGNSCTVWAVGGSSGCWPAAVESGCSCWAGSRASEKERFSLTCTGWGEWRGMLIATGVQEKWSCPAGCFGPPTDSSSIELFGGLGGAGGGAAAAAGPLAPPAVWAVCAGWFSSSAARHSMPSSSGSSSVCSSIDCSSMRTGTSACSVSVAHDPYVRWSSAVSSIGPMRHSCLPTLERCHQPPRYGRYVMVRARGRCPSAGCGTSIVVSHWPAWNSRSSRASSRWNVSLKVSRGGAAAAAPPPLGCPSSMPLPVSPPSSVSSNRPTVRSGSSSGALRSRNRNWFAQYGSSSRVRRYSWPYPPTSRLVA
uniref:Uncharacterized protein n=1 Tax=Anopheles merus TaxID=30066 RepID=A0A182VDT0_ANOME